MMRKSRRLKKDNRRKYKRRPSRIEFKAFNIMLDSNINIDTIKECFELSDFELGRRLTRWRKESRNDRQTA